MSQEDSVRFGSPIRRRDSNGSVPQTPALTTPKSGAKSPFSRNGSSIGPGDVKVTLKEGSPPSSSPPPGSSSSAQQEQSAEGHQEEEPITIAGSGFEGQRRKRIKKVSHYVLGPVLGEGVFGVVRDAIDISADPRCAAVTGDEGGVGYQRFHRCAVKMVPPQTESKHRSLMKGGDHGAAALQTSAAFRKEAANLQRFHSPYVMRAIDIFARYGKEYVVMPIAICSLQQFIESRREYAQTGMRWREAAEAAQLSDQKKSGAGHAAAHSEEGEDDYAGYSPSSLVMVQDGSSPGSGSPMESPLLQQDCHDTSSAYSGIADKRGGTIPRLSGGALLQAASPSSPSTAAGEAAAPHPLFSYTFIRSIFFQVLSGVAYLHEQRLAHNDIKPSNVLVFEDGSVRLSDLGGVSANYKDQGTPLFASPELALHFYGCDGDVVVDVDAKAADMWCCGLVLYSLVTGLPGPLPIQRMYDAFHHNPSCAGQHYPMNRYQLYATIAEHSGEPDLTAIPVADDTAAGGALRDLLAGLLKCDPRERLTAELALKHPWMEMKFVRRRVTSRPGTPTRVLSTKDFRDMTLATKASMSHAVQREVSQRVLASTHFKEMVRLDKQQHLQFAADCCHILQVAIPREILLPRFTQEGAVMSRPTKPRLPSELSSPSPGMPSFGAPEAAVGTVVKGNCCPALMPVGCVNPQHFLPSSEFDYYERRTGMAEFDLQALLDAPDTGTSQCTDVPIKKQQFEEYLYNVCMVNLGYRTMPDPTYMADGAGYFSPGSVKSSESGKVTPDRGGGKAGSGGTSTTSFYRREQQQLEAEEEPESRRAASEADRGKAGKRKKKPEEARLREGSRCFCGMV